MISEKLLLLIRVSFAFLLLLSFFVPLSVRASGIKILQVWTEANQVVRGAVNTIRAGELALTATDVEQMVAPMIEAGHQVDAERTLLGILTLNDHVDHASNVQVASVLATFDEAIQPQFAGPGGLAQVTDIGSKEKSLHVPRFTHRNEIWSRDDQETELVTRSRILMAQLAHAKYGLVQSGGELFEGENVYIPVGSVIGKDVRVNLRALQKRADRVIAELRVAVANGAMTLEEASPFISQVSKGRDAIRPALDMMNVQEIGSAEEGRHVGPTFTGLVPDLVRAGVRFVRNRPMHQFCQSCKTLADLVRIPENGFIAGQVRVLFESLHSDIFEDEGAVFRQLDKDPFLQIVRMGVTSFKRTAFRADFNIETTNRGYDAVLYQITHADGGQSLIYAKRVNPNPPSIRTSMFSDPSDPKKVEVKMRLADEDGMHLHYRFHDGVGSGGRLASYHPQRGIDEITERIDGAVSLGLMTPLQEDNQVMNFDNLHQVVQER